jgi:hypothetical protein
MQKLRESRPGNWLRGGAAAEAPDPVHARSGAAPGETGVFAGVGGTTRPISSYRFRPLKVPPGAPRNEPDAAALQRANPRLSYEAAYSRMYTHADNAGLRAEINREHLGASMGAVG